MAWSAPKDFATFSLCSVPAVAMTIAPNAFAIWIADRPTPPAAAWMRT